MPTKTIQKCANPRKNSRNETIIQDEMHINIECICRYDEEQRQLRQSFLKSFEDGSEDEGEGGLLVVRQKNDDEAADEEAKYERWLQGQAKLDASTASQLEPLREFWTNPNLNENDKFLRDYITKQLWKPRDASNYKVPLDPAVSDSEDEEAVEEQERFEKQFNFRFEEEEGTQARLKLCIFI